MIYTLYSFKGGVGRSMALANLGAYFCKKGLRVVMIDWDLEAPGLENYFYSAAGGKSIELARAAARPGLIDLLTDYKKKFPSLRLDTQLGLRQTFPEESDFVVPAANAQESSAFSDDAVAEAEEVARITREHRQRRKASEKPQAASASSSELTQPQLSFSDVLDRALPSIEQYLQPIETPTPGGLWLLAAGARPPEKFGEYADAVQDFDWLEFIAEFDGKTYLEWLRGKLSALAEVVLIDSRTGVTEMSGICTRQMADAVVAFCAPNNQNVDGVARIVSSFETPAARNARYDRELQVLVIPTRIDDSESGLLGEFSARFADIFENNGLVPALMQQDRPLWNLRIPYIPKYNYREQLVISPLPASPKPAAPADPPTERLIKAYENIALHLAVLAPESSPLRLALQAEIAGAFPYLLPQKAPHMTAPLPVNWVERPALAGALKEALLGCAKAPQGGRLAIWGQAGAGKSTLLAHVCDDAEIVAAFPDGIIWLTLEGAWAKERVHGFPPGPIRSTAQRRSGAITRALEDKRFLFVVDDVWAADQLDAVFAFGKRDSRVIITRDRAAALQFASTVFTVGKLTEGESRELLKIPAEMLGKSVPTPL